MARITIEIPDELAASLSMLAAAGGVTEGEYLLALLFDASLRTPERAASLAAGLADLSQGRTSDHAQVRDWLLGWGDGPPQPAP